MFLSLGRCWYPVKSKQQKSRLKTLSLAHLSNMNLSFKELLFSIMRTYLEYFISAFINGHILEIIWKKVSECFRSDPWGHIDSTTQQLDNPNTKPEAQRSTQRGKESRERELRYVGLSNWHFLVKSEGDYRIRVLRVVFPWNWPTRYLSQSNVKI